MHMFKNAQMFELINEVDKLLIPILEARRDFKKLQMLHQRLGEAYGKILTTVSEIFQFFLFKGNSIRVIYLSAVRVGIQVIEIPL